MPESNQDIEAMFADLEGVDAPTPGVSKLDPKKMGMPKQILDAAGLNG